MAQGDTPITVVGNLVADPELRFIPSGAAVANFRIASTPRTYNRETNQFEDGEALFLTCNCWRQMAENVAETLTKGMRVIVNGRLKQRSYQDKEGNQRTVFEVEVDEVGPSLRYASASVSRNPREGGYGGGQNQGGNVTQGNFGGGQQGGGFGGAPAGGGFGGNNDGGFGGAQQGGGWGGQQQGGGQAAPQDPWSGGGGGGWDTPSSNEPPF